LRDITEEEIDQVLDSVPEKEFQKFDFVVEQALEQKVLDFLISSLFSDS
jgi:hypothetical protein